MAKYIVNDLKRAFGSKWTKVYLWCTLALVLIANIAVICFRFIYGSNEGTFAYNVFEYASWCFLIPYYSCIMIGIIAVGKGYIRPKKGGNVLGAGDTKVVLAPWQLYIAKLIVAILLALFFLVAAFAVLYVITQLFHVNEGLIPWMIIRSFLNKAALAIPLWFAGISFVIMFLFLIDRKWKACIGFAVVTVIIPQIIRIFSLDSIEIEFFRTVRKYTITQSFGLVPYPSYPERSVPLIVAIGLVYGIVAMIIGIVLYNKKAS